jgi:hypothetical protein
MPKKLTPDPIATLASQILAAISRPNPPASALEAARKFLKQARLHHAPERAQIDAKLDAQLRSAVAKPNPPASLLETHRRYHAERATLRSPTADEKRVEDANLLAHIGQCCIDSGITEFPFDENGKPNPRFRPRT